MNCKPGDLAIVVRSTAGNEGKIVRCLRLATAKEADSVQYWSGALWHTDVALKNHRYWGLETRMLCYCPDDILRPIRPQSDDATDESLSWKPLPLPEIVPAMLDREVA